MQGNKKIHWQFKSWAERAVNEAFIIGTDDEGNNYEANGTMAGDEVDEVYDIEFVGRENLDLDQIKYLIIQNERSIEILEAIEEFERRKKLNLRNLRMVGEVFPSLKSKYVYAIDINDRCIKRMNKVYNSFINN